MSAPVKVEMSSLSGPWPGFTISGVGGASAALVNGSYVLMPGGDPDFGYRYYTKSGGSTIVWQPDKGYWQIDAPGNSIFFVVQGAVEWPWQAVWIADSGAVSGVPAFTRIQVAPLAGDLGPDTGPAPAVAASGMISPAYNDVYERSSETLYGASSTLPGFYWVVGGSSYWALRASNVSADIWKSPNVGTAVAVPSPATPDLVGTWTASGGITGSLKVARHVAPPRALGFAGSEATVQASLTTAFSTSNSNLVFTAKEPGRMGNVTRIQYVKPSITLQPISVQVTARAITVNLATGLGVAQVESITVGGTAAANGNPSILLEDSVISIQVSVSATTGETASSVATKLRAALTANATVSARYTVGGTVGNIVVTRKVAEDNDSSLRMVGDNGGSMVLFTISAHTTPGTLATVASTGSQVRAAVQGNAAAAALVTVALAPGNNGGGFVSVLGATNLSGGTGGLPFPPERVTLAGGGGTPAAPVKVSF